MVINHLVRRITFNVAGTKSRRTARGIIVTSAGVGIYGFVKWASCDTASNVNIDKRLANGPLEWLHDVYTEQILHSSVFRFGRAAYTVSIILLVFLALKYYPSLRYSIKPNMFVIVNRTK